MKRFLQILLPGIACAVLVAGCRGVPTGGEKTARHDLEAVEKQLHAGPHGDKILPPLTPESGLSNFLAYALLNSPDVEAAYDDWAASVERITVARSAPDPKLTFQAYIQDSLTSLMPGLMQDFPGPGKLNAAAEVATAESRGKYAAFEATILQAAYNFKSAYYNLYFLGERLRINHRTLELLADTESVARARNEAGKGSLQDVYRVQMERGQLATDIANLEHSSHLLATQYKAALGMKQEQPNPPLPATFESGPSDINEETLLASAFARSPRLKALEAEVRTAEASIARARKSNVPDFSAGLQAEVYSPPFYWPQASATLPVWRDKIAAEIAAAQDGKQAAKARLTAGQIGLAVDFAMRIHDYRETTLNRSLLENQLIPKARQSLEIARAGFVSGQVDFFNLTDAERSLLNFQLQDVQEQARCETILADLSLNIAGIAPAGAPVLAASPETSSTNHLQTP